MRIQLSKIVQWVRCDETNECSVKSGKSDSAPDLLRVGARVGDVLAVRRAFALAYAAGLDLDVNKRDKFGRTALMDASFGNHIIVVKCLLAHGANPNDSDKNGKTALHYAVDRKTTCGTIVAVDGIPFDTLVQVLMSSGACTAAQDCNGQPPFSLAFQKHSKPAMNALVCASCNAWKTAFALKGFEKSGNMNEEPDSEQDMVPQMAEKEDEVDVKMEK